MGDVQQWGWGSSSRRWRVDTSTSDPSDSGKLAGMSEPWVLQRTSD